MRPQITWTACGSGGPANGLSSRRYWPIDAVDCGEAPTAAEAERLCKERRMKCWGTWPDEGSGCGRTTNPFTGLFEPLIPIYTFAHIAYFDIYKWLRVEVFVFHCQDLISNLIPSIAVYSPASWHWEKLWGLVDCHWHSKLDLKLGV